jgi:predicted transcriptional regulator
MEAWTQDLRRLGLTGTEAAVYGHLLQRGAAATGYEVAQAMGLPRANVYAALQRLWQRGAVQRLDGPDAVRYWAVPLAAFGSRVIADLEQRIQRWARVLGPGVGPPEWAVEQGWEAFEREGRRLVEAVRERLLVGASVPVIYRLAEAVHALRERAVRRRYTCFSACPGAGCGVCEMPVRHAAPPEPGRLYGILGVDDRHALMAMGTTDQAWTVRTDFPPMVAAVTAWLEPREPETRGR